MSKKYQNPIAAYLQSAFEEWGKITWPTREQTIVLAGVTIGLSAVLVLVLAGVDAGFNELYRLATSALSK